MGGKSSKFTSKKKKDLINKKDELKNLENNLLNDFGNYKLKIINIQNLKKIDKFYNKKCSKNQIIENWHIKIGENKISDDNNNNNNNSEYYFPEYKYDYLLNSFTNKIINNKKIEKNKMCINNENIKYDIIKFINEYTINKNNKHTNVQNIFFEYKNSKYYNPDVLEKIKNYDKYENFQYSKDILDDDKFTNECIDYIYNLYENSNVFKYKLYEENIPATEYSNNNNFYMAFYSAYNSHGSIILSPDDIWIQICLNFSKYVNEFSEELRYLFVNHKDKKELKVKTNDINIDFKFFSKEILKQIKKNTKDNLTDKLSCNFTTSGIFENFMSNVVTMDCMRNYFEYTYEISCGIKEVQFLGTLDDWNKLLNKTKKLLKYNLPNNQWKKYINELLPILEKFIDTYKGNKNKVFWDSIVYEEFGKGYGMGKPYKLSGWLTKFFYGNNENYERINKIPILNTKVPVKIIYPDKTEENVNIYAGFSGINEENLVYRPQMSVVSK